MQLHVCELIAGLNEEKPEWAASNDRKREREKQWGRDREDRSLIALLRYAIQVAYNFFVIIIFRKCEKLAPNGQQVLFG